MREYLIRLPWPPKECAPNGQHGHWRKKSSAAKAYKEACAWQCKSQNVQPVTSSLVVVEATFCAPSKRPYDLDNAVARAKQGLDAIAEAIGVDDAKWQEMRLLRGDKVKDGCILVRVVPCESIPIVGWVDGEWRAITEALKEARPDGAATLPDL